MSNKQQYSSLKIFHHKEALDAIKDGKHIAPFYIRIKPTNLCNHHCSYCTYGAGNSENKTENRDTVVRTDMIPWGKMQEIICDMGDMGVKAVTFSGGGEPLTYPYIVEAVQMMKDRNIDLSLISNGQLLSGETAKLFYDAKWVRISFDSPNEAEYMQLRNVSAVSFQTVCNNIKNFAVNKAKNCVLGINYVISKANASRVYEAAVLLKSFGVNNVKFAAVVENTPNYHNEIKDSVIKQIHCAQKELTSSEFSVINNYENDWMDKNFVTKNFPHCYTCGLVTVIAADCKAYYCHTRAYDSKAVIGDLAKQSFKHMWFSEKTIRKLNKLNPMRDCKNFCVYEERNMLIQDYFDVDSNHINFI
jgi:MoaA/NifB/PqqE/SkfB family radical SAM enzyme